jgi:hypothetical protein
VRSLRHGHWRAGGRRSWRARCRSGGCAGGAEARDVVLRRSSAVHDDAGTPARRERGGRHRIDVLDAAAHPQTPVALDRQLIAKLEILLRGLEAGLPGDDDSLTGKLRRHAPSRALGVELRARHAVLGTERHRFAHEKGRDVRLDIGHRCEGRTRAFYRSAAIDGDGGRHGLQPVHRRALEALQKLTRVGAEALDEAALTLRIQRVEREAALPGA